MFYNENKRLKKRIEYLENYIKNDVNLSNINSDNSITGKVLEYEQNSVGAFAYIINNSDGRKLWRFRDPTGKIKTIDMLPKYVKNMKDFQTKISKKIKEK